MELKEKCCISHYAPYHKTKLRQLLEQCSPRPALKLWSLDLSGNELTFFPHDFFVDMVALKEVKLDNNYLATIYPILRIWKKLTHLQLQGNPLKCYQLCRFLWQIRRPMFFDSTTCNSEDQMGISIISFRKSCRN